MSATPTSLRSAYESESVIRWWAELLPELEVGVVLRAEVLAGAERVAAHPLEDLARASSSAAVVRDPDPVAELQVLVPDLLVYL